MRSLLLGLVLVVLVALSAALPSDLIQKGPIPALMSLSGTSPGSAKAIDATNGNLSESPNSWVMPDLGHYFSGKREAVQSLQESVTKEQIKFSEAAPKNLSETNVGNTTENFTIINETMVWI